MDCGEELSWSAAPAGWEAALADDDSGMAAGTPTAITAAAATVPASIAFDRPSGSGASPISHWVHCFMACSQLFIDEPLRPLDTRTAGGADILFTPPVTAPRQSPVTPRPSCGPLTGQLYPSGCELTRATRRPRL